MAIFYRDPEKSVLDRSLEGLLGGLGDIGNTALQSYIEKNKQQKRKDALTKAGYPEDIADQIAAGGDQAASQALQQKYQQQQQQQQNLQYVNAQRMMQGLPPIQLPGQQQQQMGQQEPLSTLDQLGPKPIPSPQEASMQRQEQQQMQQTMQQQQGGKEPTQEDMFDLAVLYGQMTPQQAMKAKQDLKKEERKAEEVSSRETFKWREKQLDKKEAIEQNLDRLKILKKISKSGKLDNKLWTSALKTIGLGDVRALQGTKTQEYNKIIADFISSANAMFPGRVTDAKLKMFMQRLPTADLDPEARKEIIKDLEYFMKSELAGPNAMLELLKENKGKPYPGIMEETAARAEQIRDRYAPMISFVEEEQSEDQDLIDQTRDKQDSSGGILETLKEIPRVAAQGLKGATQVPLRAAEFVSGFMKKPEIPEGYYKGRGLTPEQEARSEEIRKLGQRPKLSESIEYITPKPKTAIGKQAGEYAETLGSLLVPLPGMQGVALGKAAKLAGVGQIAKWASETIGGASEKTSDRFKLGSMVLFSFGGNMGPIKEAKKIYEEGKKFIPKDVTASTGPLRKIGEELEKNFDPSIMKDAKSQQMYSKLLDNFRELTDYQKVPIIDVWDFKKKIPEMVEQASKYSKSAANPFYELRDQLSRYLKSHPDVPAQARKAMKIGDELYSGYNNIMKTSKTIKDAALKLKGLSLGTLGILGLGTKTTGGIVGVIGAAKTGYAFAKEMLTNPSIRHHFAKTAQLAAKESKGPLLKEITRLDEAVKKQKKNNKS